MFTLRSGAIVVTLGMFAGVGINSAQACDNDRFPCPVVSEAVTQDTVAAPAEPVQVAQPPKKASQSARPATKPEPKAEQNMPRAKVAKRHPLPARRVKRRLRSSGLLPAPRMISPQRRRYLLLRLFSRQLRMNHPRKRIKLWWRLPGQRGRLFPPSIVPR